MKIEKSNVQDIWPLNPVQEGFLFHYLQGNEEGKYVECLMLGVEGNVVDKWFTQSWEHIFQFNEALRSVFKWEQLRNPVQIVLKNKKPGLEIYDFTDANIYPKFKEHLGEQYAGLLDQIQNEEQLIELIEKAASERQRVTVFNLAEETIKITLCKFKNQSRLFLTYHHILLDGWSLGIILEEWLTIYRTLEENKIPTPRSQVSMRSILAEIKKNHHRQAEKQFWVKHLAGFEIRQPLQPLYEPSKKEFKKVTQTLSAEMFASIERFCKNSRMSLATFVYGTWAILLQRFLYTDDVVFGTTVSGRTLNVSGIDSIVGMLINTVPLRIQSDDQDTVQSFFVKVNGLLAARRPHELTALSSIRSDMDFRGKEELFDTLVVIENYPLANNLVQQRKDWGDGQTQLHFSSYTMDEHTHYPLTLLVKLDEGLVFELIYDNAKYEHYVVEQMGKCLVKLLEDMSSNLERKLCEIALIQPDSSFCSGDFSPFLTALNDGKLSISELFIERARKHPERIAIISEEGEMTYGELDALSNAIALELIRKGAGPEQCVGIQSYRRPETIAGLLAILKAGAAYVPIHPDYPGERIRFIIDDTAMNLLLAESEFTAMYAKFADIQGIDPKSFYYQTEEQGEIAHLPDLQHETSGKSLAYIVYTSGSTGQPKGVMIEHRGVIRLVKKTEFVEFRMTDVILATCPLEFDVSNFEIWGALLNGSALCLLPQEKLVQPRALKKAILEHQVSVMWMTTPLFNQLAGVDESLFASLRYLIVGGDTLSPVHMNKVREVCPGLTLMNGYGPSENSVLSTAFHITKNYEARIPIGKPITRSTAYIVDRYNHLLPAGAIGELCVGLEGVARGYLNKPEMTQAKFIHDPMSEKFKMYKTGDRARWLPDGNIDFLGRADFQVKVRGYRVELLEVETAIGHLKEIEACVVQVTHNSNGEKELTAYVATKQHIEIHGIREELARTLPSYAIPTRYIQLDVLPLTINGKIDNEALLNASHKIKEFKAARSSLPSVFMEQKLLQIWKEVLGKESIKIDDGFFDIGGNSLSTIQISDKVYRSIGIEISVTDLFQYPTVRELSTYLLTRQGQVQENKFEARTVLERSTSRDIAVIGMAGRFPGAQNVEIFWRNLQNGEESITFFTEQELRESGISEKLLSRTDYVKAKGMLEDMEYFDAKLFEYSAQEAELMDPQLRLLHECVWTSLEHAGYDPERYKDAIGLFVGATMNLGWVNRLFDVVEDDTERWKAAHLNVHSLSMPISYKLNLKGPSLTVETACSSSLVAVHLACQSLLSDESVIALAGGVSLTVPKKSGYVYQDGMIKSPDGHCRAFDAEAKGTVSGDGVGIVVLKKLEDALRDGDHVYGVIKGSAINNDGTRKAGFTAPSVTGQMEVIAEALKVACVTPESISYVETHGTGTPLGDPIEIEALSGLFRSNSVMNTAIGSVKTNIGHLDAAAGVAGFIKTILSLYHRKLPPSLHYVEANPKIDFKKTCLYVNHLLQDWSPPEGYPRRAGVSSFGIGGTNAHIVVEESPLEQRSITSKPVQNYLSQIFVFSARTEAALRRKCEDMLHHLESALEQKLHDIAYTLSVGRKQLDYRIAFVATTREELRERLHAFLSGSISSVRIKPALHVVYLFPGQGAQYANMAGYLYDTESFFRAEMDRCLEIAGLFTKVDLRGLWMSTEDYVQKDNSRVDQLNAVSVIDQTGIAQPLLFMMEYSLARLLQHWGIHPAAMMGHSLGEYVAACISGVLSLEEAIQLVIRRSSLMQTMVPGEMIGVNLGYDRLISLLDEWTELSIAASNSPEMSVVSGPLSSISHLSAQLQRMNIEPIRLKVSHAFHSCMMEPMMNEFGNWVRKATLSSPQIPYVSNLTAEWITSGLATDPNYYVSHVRQTVRFREGLELLADQLHPIFLEVGPGSTLSQLVRHNPNIAASCPVATLIPRMREKSESEKILLEGILSLWMNGANVDWHAFYEKRRGRRIALPTYPFEKQYYWKYAEEVGAVNFILNDEKRAKIVDWLYVPQWTEKDIVSSERDMTSTQEKETVLLLTDYGSLTDKLSMELERQGVRCIRVYSDPSFKCVSDMMYLLDPGNPSHFIRLYDDIINGDVRLPSRIIHLWGMDSAKNSEIADFDNLRRGEMDRCLYSLIYLIQAAGRASTAEPIDLTLGTRGMERVDEGDQVNPVKSMLLGAASVIPLEYPNICVHSLDCDPESLEKDPAQLLSWSYGSPSQIVKPMLIRHALRKGHRYVHEFTRMARVRFTPSMPVIKWRGSYLITGGLSGIGFVLARYLAERYQARLVLLGRTSHSIPQEVQWIQEVGGSVHIEIADVTDRLAMERITAEAVLRYGVLDGAFHAAGIADQGGLLHSVKRDHIESVLAPKVEGTLSMHAALKKLNRPPSFLVLFSSISSTFGAWGQASYAAANAFLDGFAHACSTAEDGMRIVSIDWDTWSETGMAVDAVRRYGGTRQGEQLLDSEPLTQAHPLLTSRSHTLWDAPLRTETVKKADSSPITTYVSMLSSEKHWVLDGHRLLGTSIVPGTAYLEMVTASFKDLTGSAQMEIVELMIVKPLPVEGETELRMTWMESGKGEWAFSVVQRGETESWDEHAKGIVTAIETATDLQFDAESFQGMLALLQNTEHVSEQYSTNDLHNRLDYGSHWNNVRLVSLNEQEGVAELCLDGECALDFADYAIHPALMDRAVSFMDVKTNMGEAYLPFAYKNVKIYGSLNAKIYSYAQCIKSNNDMQSYAVKLMDHQGRLLIEIGEFMMSKVHEQIYDAKVSLIQGMKLSTVGNSRLSIEDPGNLESLHFLNEFRNKPKPGEVEIRVAANGLNFKEVLYALGMLQAAPAFDSFGFGLECTGTVARVGEGVTTLKIGDRVMSIASSSFGKYVCIKENSVMRIPSNLSFVEAATIPIAFMTAYYSLVIRGQLIAGERVLIHSATGGVGLAAIQIAKWIGAEIYATAGTEDKRNYLRSIGIRHVYSSRDLEFAEQILAATGHVDVILNSLTGEAIEKGLALLGPHGRLLELGIRDIKENHTLGMKSLANGISLSAISIDSQLPGYNNLFREIARLLEEGVLSPLPFVQYDLPDTGKAFRFMASASHIGKIVIVHNESMIKSGEPLSPLQSGIHNAEGMEALEHIMKFACMSEVGTGIQCLLSVTDLHARQAKLQPGLIEGMPATSKSTAPTRMKKRSSMSTEYVAPVKDTEKKIALIISEFLELDKLGIHDNFFEAGATSLDLIQINTKINTFSSKDHSVVKMYSYPTVYELNQYLFQDQMDDPDDQQMNETQTAQPENERRKISRLKTLKSIKGLR